MKEYISKCRNCDCLHFYKDISKRYPEKCYCAHLYYPARKECKGYEPADNLEFLEWKYEKQR